MVPRFSLVLLAVATIALSGNSLHQEAQPPGPATSPQSLLAPLVLEANRRRLDREADPHYGMSPMLNQGRVNLLLFGYGETHEPPMTEKAIIGSHTVVSYDVESQRADVVSLTHDIRAPEIERHTGAKRPMKMDKAYMLGGFLLNRRVLENATGLSVDFQIVFRDTVIRDFVDEVLGGLVVEIPRPFSVNAFYLDGVKYPAGEFAPGVQRINGTQVIQFIKTVAVEKRADRSLEHNVRKQLVFDAILGALREKDNDLLFWGEVFMFLNRQVSAGQIVHDLPLEMLAREALWSLVVDAPDLQIGRALYVSDSAHGDGGVQWVKASSHPVVKREIAEGRYDDYAMEIPIGGDPYAQDLVVGYWQAVRTLVRDGLGR